MAAFEDCRVPVASDKVFKDQCIFSFDTPLSPDGLYICLKRFYAVGRDWLATYHEKTGSRAFLRHRQTKTRKTQEDASSEKKPCRLAIGVAGGFSAEAFETCDEYHIVTYPDMAEYALDAVPDTARSAAEAIIASVGVSQQAAIDAASAAWDGEMRVESNYSRELKQIAKPADFVIAAKCERCDKTDNLWLNLSSGSVLCGRKNFDGTGGNNHAVDFFEETSRQHPLAVKLGTITPAGADVFSYPEDTMVLNAKLAEHLAHWGIDMASSTQTDATMAELEVELNSREWEFLALTQTDGGEEVVGPGTVGLVNIGNSCYFNSILQMFFSLPGVCLSEDYVSQMKRSSLDTLNDSLHLQVAKIGHFLARGAYPPSDDRHRGIEPKQFRTLLGRVLPDFGTSRQQDSFEFFLLLLDQLDSALKATSPSALFRHEQRTTLLTNSGLVKYVKSKENSLSVPIAGTPENQALVSDQVRPQFSLEKLLRRVTGHSDVEGLKVAGETVEATSQLGLSTFPPVLVLHMKKFALKPDYTPYKIDCEIQVPDALDVSFLRSVDVFGAQPMPDSSIDADKITQLTAMGFPETVAKKALYYTGNDLEQAISWVFEHSQDPDFETPLSIPLEIREESHSGDNTAAVEMICNMGFSAEQASVALRVSGGDVERAVERIFAGDLPTGGTDPVQPPDLKDGLPQYRLAGFVSHMGSSVHSGHYVAHIKQADGTWLLFNDEHVTRCPNPPSHLAYIYFYART